MVNSNRNDHNQHRNTYTVQNCESYYTTATQQLFKTLKKAPTETAVRKTKIIPPKQTWQHRD